MLTKVTSLTVLAPYMLAVRFSDGTSGVHDCAKMVEEDGALVEPLRDARFFAQAFLDEGAPAWPNGFDIDPEWLRLKMLEAHELQPDAAAE